MSAVATKPHESEDNVIETTSDLSGVWTILKFGKGVRMQLIGATLLIVCSAAFVMVSARILGELVETLVAGNYGSDAITRLGLVFLSLEAGSVALQYFGRLGLAHATIEIAYEVRRQLFRKLCKLPIAYFDSQPLGRTLTRLTTDVEGIENFFSGTVSRITVHSINLIMVLIAMLVTNLRFGLIIIAVSIPAIIFSMVFRKPIRRWLRIYRKRNAKQNAMLAENLNGMPVIRVFGLERWTLNRFQTGQQDQLDAALNMMNWNSVVRPLIVLLCSMPTLLILWWGGQQVLEGAMALGILVAFVRYSERFISPVRAISQEIQHIQEALVSSERVSAMLNEPEEDSTLGKDGTHKAELQGDVEFDQVWMSYKAGDPILKGVSFKVKKGMNVALVGATGSGKSTTINLIPRLYPIEKGILRLDGVPVEEWSRETIREHLGYVSQDVVIFTGSVRENLIAAVPEGHRLSDEQVLSACRKTGLTEILAKFPQGLDHHIIEGGANLSMGEKQLIAFTRMLLKNPAILILDEATANIDERCEELIQQAVGQVMTGRTCFIIAHRLSTILKADLILVFRDGQIIERGSHTELMAQGGHYAELATRQLVGLTQAT